MKLRYFVASSFAVVMLVGCTRPPRQPVPAVPASTAVAPSRQTTLPDISQVRGYRETTGAATPLPELPPMSPAGDEAARREAYLRGTQGMPQGKVYGGRRPDLSIEQSAQADTKPPLPAPVIVQEPAKPKLELPALPGTP